MRGRAMALLTRPTVRLLAGAPVLALALAFLLVGQVRAAGTVGTGTAGSCDEAAFDAAFAGGGVVTFDCGTAPVTITFTTTKTVTADTQINGSGLITISGGDSVQLFVTDGFDLVLSGLTLRDAFVDLPGRGAVVNATNALVVFVDSTVTDNLAEFQGGAVSLQADGGFEGRLVFANSTVANNTTNLAAGGAIYAVADGGGAPCPAGSSDITIVFVNSTFSGNSGSGVGQVLFLEADDQICTASADAQILYSTLGDDAGGTPTIHLEGNATAEVAASIIGPNAHCSGIIPILPTSLGYNVVSDAGCIVAGTGDVIGDPMVGPLANNGGPTQTRALLTGSPAEDLVPLGFEECGDGLPGDQRGETRPQGPKCDAGAYEGAVLTDTALGQPAAPAVRWSPWFALLGAVLLLAGLNGAAVRGRARR